MRTKLVEATQSPAFNWGKFMLLQFDYDDAQYQSQISKHQRLLAAVGYQGDLKVWLWVLDLQTGEGAVFPVLNNGLLEYDIKEHQIRVCPMYKPFLEWLYANFNGNLEDIPSIVEVQGLPGLVSRTLE